MDTVREGWSAPILGDPGIIIVQKLKREKKLLKYKAKDWFVNESKLASLKTELAKLQKTLISSPMDLETPKSELDTTKLIIKT